jgi:hypothetical protein
MVVAGEEGRRKKEATHEKTKQVASSERAYSADNERLRWR